MSDELPGDIATLQQTVSMLRDIRQQDVEVINGLVADKQRLQAELDAERAKTPPPQPLSVGSRWRVFEDTTPGYWGIELEQASNDSHPIMYPIKIHRERVAIVVDTHNAEVARLESLHRSEIADMAERFRSVNVSEAVKQLADILPTAPAEHVSGVEPLFWYRPVGEDGGYEGPHHASSQLGKTYRDAMPGQWKPLFTAPVEPVAGWEDEEKLTGEQAWTILCETPDVTSPEEYPDHALITMDQLGSFMARALARQWIPADQAPRGSYGLIRHRSGLIDVVYKTNNGEPFLETWRYAGTARGGEQAPWPDAFMPLDRAASAEVER